MTAATSLITSLSLGLLLVDCTSCFVTNTIGWIQPSTTKFWLSTGDILDADYERVTTVPESETSDTELWKDTEQSTEIPIFRGESLLDLTLLDNNITFPFVDPKTQRTLNCRLAVTAELEDKQLYAVGVPAQHGVLMIIERDDESDNDSDPASLKSEYLDPDLDDNSEILEIMAGALQKYVAADLVLQRTPRILTIAGDLDRYVNALPSSLVPPDITMDKLMEEPDGDLDKLYDFFKEQLGKEAFDQAMEEASDMGPDIMSMFEMGSDDEGKDEDCDESLNPLDLEEAFRNLSADIQHEGVGIKLVGFQINNNDGKNNVNSNQSFYCLVKPIKPLTVVGRLKSEGRETVFELLTPEEEVLIVPRLEQICKEDMESQGLL